MKQNICVIGLNNNFVAKLGKSISDAFDMFFADVTEFIKYELIDVNYARVLAGEDYVKKVEASKVKAVNSFENTLFTMDYSLLNNDKNLQETKNSSYIIYLKISKDKLKELIKNDKTRSVNSNLIYDVYEFRDRLCLKYADFVVDVDNKSTNEIIKEIENLFLGVNEK